MKRVLCIICSLLFLLSPVCVFATENEENMQSEEKIYSKPRLMVTSYEISGGHISPENTATLSITIKNTSNTTAVKNIKLSLHGTSENLRCAGMPSEHINMIYAGSSFQWKKKLKALYNIEEKEHTMTLTMEYEDSDGLSYVESETIYIEVRQSTELSFSGVMLPLSMVQGENTPLSIELMNTGKADLYNCRVQPEIDSINCSGSLFAGNISSGEQRILTVTLRSEGEKLGKTTGKITIFYEDSYGMIYTETVEVSTEIKGKPVGENQQAEFEKGKNSLWWLFLSVGIITGGVSGILITYFINDSKKRKEDDKRL